MWRRLRNFINRITGGGQEPFQPPPPPAPAPFEAPPPIEPAPFYQEPAQPIYEESGPDLITIYDYTGTELGTQTYEGWYADTLLSGVALAFKYGGAVDNIDLIHLLEDNIGREWTPEEWRAWRENYAAING